MNDSLPFLLVDDNEDDIFFAKRALKEAQIINPVQVAADGQAAVDYLSGAGKFSDRSQFPLPSLMLLDLKMPGKGGLEVLQWVRANPATKGLVVVILTTSREQSDIEQAYRLGVNSFLLKPSNIVVLTEMMKALKAYWLAYNQFFEQK